MPRSPERLSKLLRQNRIKHRAAELVRQWAASGVSASPIADDRHGKLIDRIRGGRSWHLDHVEDLARYLRDFIGQCDVVTVIGWDIEEEPPVLISSAALLRSLRRIERVYPDGFILIRDDSHKALIVDLDAEEGIHANVIDVPV